MAYTLRSKRKKKTTKRRPSKKKFLEKFVVLEGSPSPRDPLKVALSAWRKLWKHQRDAAQFTLKRYKNFLAMEVGTGKTLTTLASLARRHVRGSVDFVLIICSASAIHTWKTEIAHWLRGTDIKFVIVSFDFARFYFKYLRKEVPDAVVIDEIQKMKNPNSGQSRRIAKAVAHIPVRYGLTGESISDTVIDLFGQYRAIDPSILGDNWKQFRDSTLTRGGFMGHELSISDENKRKVLRAVEPITFQVLKREVLGHKLLPPVRMYAQLKGTQKKLYKQLQENLVAHHDEFTISTDRIVTQMIRLQQITGGHCPEDHDDEEDYKTLTFECGKADLLKELLGDWNRDKKLVIFARYVYELDLIQDICKKKKFSSYIYTPAEAEIDDDFQKKKHPQVSISQTQRGGLSRTLTKASTAVFFSKTFSYLDYYQDIGRVDRGGQTEAVTPIFLTTEGTIDEDVDIAIEIKQKEALFVKEFIKKLKNRLRNS